MEGSVNLASHISLTSADAIAKITKPLATHFLIKHFRFLRLYQDGTRILLSNFRDCTRFVYEEGHYTTMRYDGCSPEHLVDGWHLWNADATTLDKTDFEKDINNMLGLHHGLTFVSTGVSYWEIFTFDSDQFDIHFVDKAMLRHFMFYFKEQANKILKHAEQEKLIIPDVTSILRLKHPNESACLHFLENSHINRYYLNGQYEGIYLTSKEAQCVYWLIQGKSADEIAMIEGNATKTIHRHLENVRKKLNCYKQTQLVKIVLDAGIFQAAEFNQTTE